MSQGPVRKREAVPAISNTGILTQRSELHRCLKAESAQREHQGHLAWIKPESGSHP